MKQPTISAVFAAVTFVTFTAVVAHGQGPQAGRQSVEQYGAVIGTDNPDLSGFRDRGGKAIVWHGWADQLSTW